MYLHYILLHQEFLVEHECPTLINWPEFFMKKITESSYPFLVRISMMVFGSCLIVSSHKVRKVSIKQINWESQKGCPMSLSQDSKWFLFWLNMDCTSCHWCKLFPFLYFPWWHCIHASCQVIQQQLSYFIKMPLFFKKNNECTKSSIILEGMRNKFRNVTVIEYTV